MPWTIKQTLTDRELRTGKRFVIGDAVATQVIVGLTTSAVLVAFALEFGASNFTIGLLAAIPPVARLIQIPSMHLFHRLH
jgi:hypothetical protein